MLEYRAGHGIGIYDYISPRTGKTTSYIEYPKCSTLAEEFNLYTNPVEYIENIPMYATSESGMNIFYACAKRVLMNRRVSISNDAQYASAKKNIEKAGLCIDVVNTKDDAINVIRYGFLDGKGLGGWYHSNHDDMPDEMELAISYAHNCKLEQILHIEDAIAIGLFNYEKNSLNPVNITFEQNNSKEPLLYFSKDRNFKYTVNKFKNEVEAYGKIYIGNEHSGWMYDYTGQQTSNKDIEDIYYPNIINMLGGVYYTLLANELSNDNFKFRNNINKYYDFYKNNSITNIDERVKKDAISIVHQILITAEKEDYEGIFVKYKELEELFVCYFEQGKTLSETCKLVKDIYKYSSDEVNKIIFSQESCVVKIEKVEKKVNEAQHEQWRKVYDKISKKGKRRVILFITIVVLISIVLSILEILNI